MWSDARVTRAFLKDHTSCSELDENQVLLLGQNSARVGRGIDKNQRLEPNQCLPHGFFDFVETPDCVKGAMKFIDRLASSHRGREEGL